RNPGIPRTSTRHAGCRQSPWSMEPDEPTHVQLPPIAETARACEAVIAELLEAAPVERLRVPAVRWARLGEALRHVALQRSSRDLATVAGARLAALLDADRATCLFHDGASGAL